MTDYLELLLEPVQEREEEDDAFMWRRWVVRPGGEKKEEMGQTTRRDTAPEQGEWAADAKTHGGEAVSEDGKRAGPMERLAALERAVVRGRAETVGQSRGLRLRRAEDTREAERRGDRSAEDMRSGVRRELAGELDAAFERDARRYDGPLRLF